MGYGWVCTSLEPQSFTLADIGEEGNTATKPLASVTRLPGGEWQWCTVYSQGEAEERGLRASFGTEPTKLAAQQRAEEFIVAYDEAKEAGS